MITMPYGGTTPEQDKKIEKCVSEIMKDSSLMKKYPDVKERKTHAIAICKARTMKKSLNFEQGFNVKEFSETEEGNFYIEGSPMTDDLDRQGDIITADAQNKALEEMVGAPILYNHDKNRHVGTVIEAKMKDNQSWIKGLISKTEKDIIEKIKEGIINSFSIGYIPDKWDKQKIKGKMRRILTGVKIYEVSLATIPANPAAKVLGWYQKTLNEIDRMVEMTEIEEKELEETENMETKEQEIESKEIETQENKELEMRVKELEQEVRGYKDMAMELRQKQITETSNSVLDILVKKGHLSPAIRDKIQPVFETKGMTELEELKSWADELEKTEIMTTLGKTTDSKTTEEITIDDKRVKLKHVAIHDKFGLSFKELVEKEEEEIDNLYAKATSDTRIHAKASKVDYDGNPIITAEV